MRNRDWDQGGIVRNLKVLVADSTGVEGSAVALWLLASCHDVIAMTRDLAHLMAMRLMRRGARLSWVAPDSRAEVDESTHGCDGLFFTHPPDHQPDITIRH